MKKSLQQLKNETYEFEREVFLKAVGMRIRQLRIQKQWTQEMLAQEAKINDKYIYDIEVGRKCMSIWVLEKLSKALGVDIAQLFKD